MEYPRGSEKLANRKILCLTDFSRSSGIALSCAKALARAHGAMIYLLHVVVPDFFTYMAVDCPASALDQQEQAALKKLQAVDRQISDLPHIAYLERAKDVWSGVAAQILEHKIDLVVLATRGHSGFGRLLLGSTAEKVLRQSPVPVMIVGPLHGHSSFEGHFHNVVCPSDFAPASLAAAQYAASVALENQASLTLLHVIKKEGKERQASSENVSIAEALHRLHESMPRDTDLSCRPETLVEHGEPAMRILDTAKRKKADLIVLGLRGQGASFASTHMDNVAHQVIVRSACPVLAVHAPVA